MAQKFVRFLGKSDFGFDADVTAQPNQYNPIGELTVPAQQSMTFGIGGVGSGVDTREVCYVDLQDSTPAELDGSIRFVLSNATGTKTIVVAEQKLAKTRADKNDKTKGFLLGEYLTLVGQDSKMLIEYKPEGASAVTVSEANSDMLIPVTTYQ